MKDLSRRTFLQHLGIGIGAAALPSFIPAYDKPYDGKKLNIALVGLGIYANLVARGMENAEYCQLAGIVTGTPSKADEWSKKYNIPKESIYNYDNFDSIVNNKNIDLVYVTLPNSMHKEYVIRAAKAGKNVITEKPMATSVQECEEMIKACKDAGVQLAVGYRLHFEPYNLEIKRLGQEKVFGQVKVIEASFGFRAGNPTQWRLKKALAGGGPLMDVGIYCVQAIRYTLGEEPIAVTAQFGPITDKAKFAEVEESLTWQLEFPSGAISNSTTSYNANVERFYAAAERGYFELRPAYGYGPLKGRTSNGELDLPIVNHQTAQMEGISKILLDGQPLPSHITGEEGLKDMRILMAIYEAAKTGKRISLV
ncbi:MAG: Gfo/Idh/MocA family oxidoreductase [Saprospiraceae bacterium]|nr:Gfo/Idh/MocA family oxidoreductase [Saprospiraceae bacterium]